MANRNFYRCVLSNDFLGVSKEISAPNRYEFDRKVENQKRIWEEKINRELIKQNKEQMKKQAEKLTTIDQMKMQEYENIIKKISKQNHNKYYYQMLDKETYQPFTTQLIEPKIESVYQEFKVPKQSILEKIFKGKYKKRIEKEEEANKNFKIREKYYNEQLKKETDEYTSKKEKFYSEQNIRNKVIEDKKKLFENGDVQQIEEYFSYVLNNSKYPKDFLIDFDLQFIEKTNTLVVSYYLPNENIVPKIIQHKYISTRNEIDEIYLNDKKYEKLYNDVIYMCCLKTIKEILLSDDCNFISNVIYNGWIKYVDKSTGKDTESCILTIDVDKDKFNEINLDNVDYKACIKGLKGIFAPNILSLTPVVPYLNINRADSRFIEGKDVSNIIMDGFNLATMPWEDFEYFVRELFDKMFNVNGGEVKVTQASHDGGVDAIAFDDDPIRGGKFVIQAKRYNNVVPVSAVRDLYGTMIHEGATRGILVTTSFYGKEAYDFAKDKPITLIDGQALLGLLNKYGYSNLTIKIDKKS